MKEIEGYPGYFITEDGRVWSTPKSNKNKNGMWLKLFNHTKYNTYKSVSLRSDQGKVCNFLVHQLVAKTFIQNPNSLPYINHIDGNPANNNINNLEWCTPKENVIHKWYGPNGSNNRKKASNALKGRKMPVSLPEVIAKREATKARNRILKKLQK